MINKNLLESKMAESGLKRKYFCERLGLTYQGLSNKLKGENEFVSSEIKVLKEILHLSDKAVNDIFFR